MLAFLGSAPISELPGERRLSGLVDTEHEIAEGERLSRDTGSHHVRNVEDRIFRLAGRAILPEIRPELDCRNVLGAVDGRPALGIEQGAAPIVDEVVPHQPECGRPLNALEYDTVEVVVEDLAGQIFARLPGEELGDVAHLLHGLGRRQAVAVFRLKRSLFVRMAQQVRTGPVDLVVVPVKQAIGLAAELCGLVPPWLRKVIGSKVRSGKRRVGHEVVDRPQHVGLEQQAHLSIVHHDGVIEALARQHVGLALGDHFRMAQDLQVDDDARFRLELGLQLRQRVGEWLDLVENVDLHAHVGLGASL